METTIFSHKNPVHSMFFAAENTQHFDPEKTSESPRVFFFSALTNFAGTRLGQDPNQMVIPSYPHPLPILAGEIYVETHASV